MIDSTNTQISTADKDFFLLLRSGLWQRVDVQLSDSPNWNYIYELSCQQTVQGIIADGIGFYIAAHPEVKCPVFEEILNQSAQIVRQNYAVNQVQAKLCEMLSNNGIGYIVLKGQGVAHSYPRPMLRCSGDIDLFFTLENYEKAKDILKPIANSIENKPLSLECALTIDGIDVELHGAMSSGINDAADKHLQAMLDKVLNEGDTRIVTVDGNDVTVPSANFDAIYILTHTIRHLGSFGISLRQVIDWTMHMHANAQSIDSTRLHHDIEAMHLQQLCDLFSMFTAKYLGAPSTVSTVVDKSLTTSLWGLIRESGSFGHNNPYFMHLHKGRLNERFARIYYHIRQARRLRQFDTEFSNYLLRHEIKDVVAAPFRFITRRNAKLTE